MLLLANVFWGLSFPVIKAITQIHAMLIPNAGTWFAAIYTIAPRFGLAALLLALWQRRNIARISRLELKQGLVMGIFIAAGMLLQNDGLQFTAASTSAFLTQLYAVTIPIWLALRARRNPGWLVWGCCGLVLIGGAILSRFDPFGAFGVTGANGGTRFHLGRGECETLLCSFFFMGQILWLEKKEFAANDSGRLTFVIFSTGAVIFGALAVATAPSIHALAIPWTSSVWVGLTIALTLLSTIGAFLLMNRWQPKISATEAGLIYCFEPIFGSAMALFLPAWFSAWAAINYPNEHITWMLLVGGGLITLANVAIQLKPLERE